MTDIAPASARITERHFDVATAVTLAVAGLLSAWATFQSGLWDKRELGARSRANALLAEASDLTLRAGQEEGTNTAMFLQWIDARADGQGLRAEVLEAHFPSDFKAAFTAWRATQPSDISKAAPGAVLPDFTGPSRAQAEAARALSRGATAEAKISGRVADSYRTANIVLATSLFLAGIATALRARLLPLILAACLTLATAAVMMVTPVELPAWLGRG